MVRAYEDLRIRIADVPTFAANPGNLLQHWPFCYLLDVLQRNHGVRALTLVDAYAMCPFATYPSDVEPTFRRIADGLRTGKSPYEQAWRALTQASSDRYPSTAALALSLWHGPLKLVLCEIDDVSASQLRDWLQYANPMNPQVHHGDWRALFAAGLTEHGDFTIISFDPKMFDRHGPSANRSHLWPDDLDLVVAATQHFIHPVLIQLSTYSTNRDNAYPAVLRTWRERLGKGAFRSVGVLRLRHPTMMTAFFGRAVTSSLSGALGDARRSMCARTGLDFTLSDTLG